MVVMEDAFDERKSRRDMLVKQARFRVLKMDIADESHGLTTPQRCPLRLHCATALQALDCAMQIESWDVVAEAFVLIEQLRDRIEDR